MEWWSFPGHGKVLRSLNLTKQHVKIREGEDKVDQQGNWQTWRRLLVGRTRKKPRATEGQMDRKTRPNRNQAAHLCAFLRNLCAHQGGSYPVFFSWCSWGAKVSRWRFNNNNNKLLSTCCHRHETYKPKYKTRFYFIISNVPNVICYYTLYYICCFLTYFLIILVDVFAISIYLITLFCKMADEGEFPVTSQTGFSLLTQSQASLKKPHTLVSYIQQTQVIVF